VTAPGVRYARAPSRCELRGRLTAGLLSKAERGELALLLPAGLARDGGGRVVKDPNREVQERIGLVFASFLELGSVGKVLRSFRAHALTVPRRDRFGEVIWRTPTDGMISAVQKNRRTPAPSSTAGPAPAARPTPAASSSPPAIRWRSGKSS
jgi:hypothetical protein